MAAFFNKKSWLLFTLITTISWGIWGALMEIPAKNNFPPTLGYVVWSLTMIPFSLIALKLTGWKISFSPKSILYGCIIGLAGSGGQLLLFHALVIGPAYIIFPVISLSPLVTIVLSMLFLKEKANLKQYIGIGIALIAILFLSIQSGNGTQVQGFMWLILAVTIFFLWGIQALVMKIANDLMDAESIFFYMMITGIALVPFALYMTDFSQEINWGFKGPYLSALVQSLNALGALTLVYAIRYGKVIIVSPLTNALSPVITTILSLLIYFVFPSLFVSFGIGLALIAVYLLTD
jgi:uncharacterized membrane protein